MKYSVVYIKSPKKNSRKKYRMNYWDSWGIRCTWFCSSCNHEMRRCLTKKSEAESCYFSRHYGNIKSRWEGHIFRMPTASRSPWGCWWQGWGLPQQSFIDKSLRVVRTMGSGDQHPSGQSNTLFFLFPVGRQIPKVIFYTHHGQEQHPTNAIIQNHK